MTPNPEVFHLRPPHVKSGIMTREDGQGRGHSVIRDNFGEGDIAELNRRGKVTVDSVHREQRVRSVERRTDQRTEVKGKRLGKTWIGVSFVSR